MLSPRKALRIIGGKEIDEPTFGANAVEKATIKRFLDFAAADIKFQFDQMNREPGVSRAELHQAQDTAVILSNYVKSLKSGVEQMVLTEARDADSTASVN